MARWVRIEWPDQYRGTPQFIANNAQLRVKTDDETVLVTTEEEYFGRSPRILSLEGVFPIADPDTNRVNEIVRKWETPPSRNIPDDAALDAYFRRMLHTDDDETPTFEEYLDASRVAFMLQSGDVFPSWLTGELGAAISGQLSDARMCLLTLSSHTHTRLAFVRAMFAKEHAEEWITPPGEDFQGFGAMRELSGPGFQGHTMFLHPLLGAQMPWAFGAPFSRMPNGMAILLFGQVLTGRQPLTYPDIAQALLANDLLVSGMIVRAPATPRISMEHAEEAVRWWVSGVNRLMSAALDPTVFADADGWYQPADHLGFIVSFDRLFASVVAILAHTGGDEYSRRLHLFEVLDLLEGFRLGGYDTTLRPSKLRHHLEELKTVIPERVQKILIPRCERGVAALEELADGFHPGRVDDGQLIVVAKSGEPVAWNMDKAIHSYLRVVRNAGHSFDKIMAKPRDLSLLAAHDGSMSPYISDIAFLHLVRIVADPSLLTGSRIRGMGRS